jgi:uncharacterized protein (DUF1800 family)
MIFKPKTLALLLCAASSLVTGILNAQSPTVTISPGYVSIGVNQTQQYKATVTGLMDTSVTWMVNGKVGGTAAFGLITQAGLYTAPPTIPSSVLVEALASDKKTEGMVYCNVAPAGPSITSVSPNPVPTGNVTITLTGVGFVKGASAMVNSATTGATFVNSTTLTVATWVGKAGNVPVQIQNPGTLWGPVFLVPFVASGPPPPQTIAPTTANVNLGAQQQFTSANATTWTATAGTVVGGLYTAPAVMPASNKVTVTATGPGGSASATVTLIDPNAQQIAPSAVSLNLGATQQFTSAGATSWAAGTGSVSNTGFYTAPSTMTSSGTDTVSATGPGGIATATVTLIPPAPTISTVSNNGQLPLGLFSATVTGTGFVATSVAKLNGSAIGTTFSGGSLTISGFASQSGPGNLTVSNGASTSAPFPVQVGIPNPVVSAAAARRFLERAAFGPTPTDAANVQTIGETAWINQQFATAQISNYNTITGSQGGMPTHFLTNAVTNADQLRQRVAFALSQIFVTSIQKLIWNDNMVLYQNMLLADAFTNYRQIMEDVTLSPAMGQYLDMANNGKAVPGTDQVANENYARELMQLFTIGTNMLNIDGTVQVDGTGLPVPTYTQPTISEFARVYTGWTYAPAPGQPVQWGSYISSYGPMAAYPAEHDTGSKQLLAASPVGAVAPAGLSPQQDLDNALDNIFNHPNVGPFVGKLLIQHLVKSNPSPQYITRVATAFNGTPGGSPRGDMKATIMAILTDPEAIANDNGGSDQPTDGHLQEPALFIAAMVRAFGGTMNDQNYYSSELANMGQDLFNAPSVFNYYSPGYVVHGTTGLKGPEFQINTPNNAIVRANEVANLFSQYSNPVQTYGPGTSVDLTPFLSLAATPSNLVDALDLTLTHGVMPATMKTAIVTAVTNDNAGNLHRVQTACYLILTSSYYNVWH